MKQALKPALFASLMVACAMFMAFSHASELTFQAAPEAEAEVAQQPVRACSSAGEEWVPGHNLPVPANAMLPIEQVPADVCSEDSHKECIGKKNGDACGDMKICVMTEGGRDCLCMDT